MMSVLQQILILFSILLILKTAIAQKPDSDQYGPISLDESGKKDYSENTEYGKGRTAYETLINYLPAVVKTWIEKSVESLQDNISDTPKLHTLTRENPKELAPHKQNHDDKKFSISKTKNTNSKTTAYETLIIYLPAVVKTWIEKGVESLQDNISDTPKLHTRTRENPKELAPHMQNHDDKKFSISKTKNTNSKTYNELASPEFQINVENCTKSDNIYPMNHRRGLVVIFNNNFKGKSLRKGAKKDVSDMKKLWTEFGSKIVIKEDKNASEMKNILQDIAEGDKEITDGEKFNYLAVFVMSHGNLKDDGGEEIVFGNDHAPVSVKDIKCCFSNVNSRYWIGIPKLFFLQFCRGTKIDPGFKVIESDNIVSNTSKEATYCSYSDMFISYAKLSEYAALRNTQSGSWFINAINDVFRKYAGIEHVAELMTRVRSAVSSKTGLVKNKDGTITECKAIGESHNMLTRFLYLQPGRPSDA